MDEPTPDVESSTFDGEEYVENLWNEFNSRLNPQPQPQESSPSNTVPEEGAAGEQGAAEPPAAPAQEPPVQDADYWRAQAETSSKRYNDLQSDYDRRVNVMAKQLEDKFEAKFQTLVNVMTQGKQPPQQQSFAEASQDPNQFEQYLNQVVESKIAARLSSDPRMAAAQAISDGSRFVQDYGDTKNYSVLMEPAFKWFPPQQGEDYYKYLERVRGYAKEIFDNAAAQAKQAEEAAKANNGRTTTPQPAQGNRVTGEQQAAFRARANQYSNEQGVSAVASTKPKIDPYDPRKLEQNIRAMVDHSLGLK